MEQLRKLSLLDEDGRPVDEHIEATLSKLVPKFRHQFPTIQDDVADELVGEAACKMAKRERESGPLERPYGFAWKILKNLGISRLRGRSIELHRTRAETREGLDFVSRLRALDHGADQIEVDIFLDQVMKHLTIPERLVYLRKRAGYTSEEIAKERGSSVGSVDVVFTRIKQKIRRLAGVSE